MMLNFSEVIPRALRNMLYSALVSFDPLQLHPGQSEAGAGGLLMVICHDFGSGFYIYMKLALYCLFRNKESNNLDFKINRVLALSCFIFGADTMTFFLLVYWIVLQYLHD